MSTRGKDTHTHAQTHTHPTHLPTMGHTVPQWDTPLTLRHTFPHWGTDTLKLDIPTLSAPKWALTGPTDLTPPPATSPHFQYHRTHCWCCSARACREWSEEKERSREGRHTTSLLLARCTLQHITNKHTLDDGPWSVGLEVGLHTCVRHTFHAPISSRYSNHKMCPPHTLHFVHTEVCTYRGITYVT